MNPKRTAKPNGSPLGIENERYEAACEATFCAAVLNAAGNGSDRLFLALPGGGVFGNEEDWILAALGRALTLHRENTLEVSVVSYRIPDAEVERFLADWQAAHQPSS
jgi:hypothetical protein